MIKLSANLSKKVPMPDVEFSSQQYGAAMEIEVSDAADAQEITSRLQDIYNLLEKSIDQQIQATSHSQSSTPPKRSFLGDRNNGSPENGGNGHKGGNGHDADNGNFRRNGHASPAQIKMIFAVCKDRNFSRDDLVKLLQAEFNVSRPDDLSVKQASDLIGKLQKMQGARA
jgi:hypothetical protein